MRRRRKPPSTATTSSTTWPILAGQERAAVDHHVDLVRAGLDGGADVGELESSGACPEGKAVATDATFTALPRSARRATGTRLG